MEPTDNNTDTCRSLRLKVTDSSIGFSVSNTNEAKEQPENMKKVDVKQAPAASPTSLLARNAALLPSQVVRLEEISSVVPSRLQAYNSPPLLSTGSATGNPRNKTALAPGHSLMDWIRLGSSGVDLTGVGGISRNVTLKELAKHNRKSDAWIAIRGIVFNVTRYMDFHPGGVPELLRGVGKDATKLFDDVHAWVNYQSILQKCVVGRLTRSVTGDAFHMPDKSITRSTNQLSLIDPMTVESSQFTEKQKIDKIQSGASTAAIIQVDWKQTTNSIFFIYKPYPDQHSTAYRLTRINNSEFVIKIYLNNTVIRHDYDLSGDVSWPPTCTKNLENSEIDLTFEKYTKKLWDSYGSRSLGNESKNNDRIYKEYKVLSNTVLCEGVHLLVVRSEDYIEVIPIGRHVEVKMQVMGMEVSRCYTPVPSCLHPKDMAPDYTSDCLCLMVKRYDDGALSPSITALEPGKILTLSNGLGTFVVETFDDCSTIHMLAAGTGLTPMLGIIQRTLCRRNVLRINLINFNRTEENIFYRSQLDRVCADKKLQVVDVLSQPGESWTGRRGLISESMIKELVGISLKQSCVFTCGPNSFMAVAREVLIKLGWKVSQMHEFDG